MRAVVEKGEIPTRSLHIVNDGLWELWTQCWSKDVNERPTATEVLERLPGILGD
jgi:hypothetical protein